MSDIPAAIKVSGLQKSYRMGKVELNVLRGVGFEIPRGEFCTIVGASGSGKSTLLHLIGLLDRPDEGDIELHGQDVAKFSWARRNRTRCREIGFVFQFYHLLPELRVLENVFMPAMVDCPGLAWMGKRSAIRKKAVDLLCELGLGDRLRHRPRELSGGERQRVAIARALMNGPSILLADEPTGNLDSKTGQQIMDVLKKFNQDGQTILMVTHDDALAKQTHRTLHIRDGRLAE